MKKILIITLIITLTICLTSCVVPDMSDTNVETIEETQNIRTAYEEDIRLWTDKETGVQYIIYSNKAGYAGMGGITPRLNTDDSPYIEG